MNWDADTQVGTPCTLVTSASPAAGSHRPYFHSPHPSPPPPGALLSQQECTHTGEEEKEKHKHSCDRNRPRLSFPVLAGRPRCPGQAKVLLAAPEGSPRSPRPVSFPPPSAPRMVIVILVGPAATPLRGSAPWGRTEKSGCAGGPTHPSKRRTAAGRPLLSGSVPQWGGEGRLPSLLFPRRHASPILTCCPGENSGPVSIQI